ncbi:MAG: long-chain-acyl-CoA synthetase, partial [Candidatus Methylomirabilis sp.]|nr:long-chain-acyl-CoA synthetase [Deltaproteobacteria bacterium]
RWKGENVSTNEVAEVLNKADGVLESNVYGVQVPHTEGRAGMAALTVGPEFDLDAFAKFACEKLPNFQRPHFLRVLKGDMRITGTFKHQKVDYRNEGFDPRRIQDPLYFLQDGKYHPIDLDLYKKVEVGDLAPQ